MPGSTPTYGFLYALGGDPRRDFPAVVNQPQVEAVETELARVDEATRAQTADQLRASTDSFPSGSMQSLGMTASITTAPDGIYLATWRLILSASAPTTGNLRVLVSGINVTSDSLADLDTSRRVVSGSHVVVHSGGGSVSISPQFQAATAGGTVHADSHISVTRVGVA